MGDHRAPRGARVAQRGDVTTSAGYAGAGKRRAAKHGAPRGPLVSGLPSAPVLLGVAALSVSATGAVSAAAADSSNVTNDAAPARFAAPANALGGESVVSTSSLEEERAELVSRDSARDALATASSTRLEAAAEAQAQERSTALGQLAKAAQSHADELAANRWVLPLTAGTYRISEGFGEGYAWRGYGHTGLDFATPSGSPVFAVASGTVISAQYAGGCGYMVELRLEDGTELKYCHNSSLATSVGAEVKVGDVIAYSGNTGHSTGPHVHLEVHPGGGDAVDPYAALVANGATP
ncbi:M23 family metallopeptidase [Nocardioides sp.]|uniref:M23 family metallopeptidase n=1 Tax=Nocardioides sp. TaxID=35761 RepID=UPI002CA37541|nr:M23 family metallopeptidase [Nocardioides sp.]HSX69172.1 M23 family metallopeptidase [Nocardioides sp.]